MLLTIIAVAGCQPQRGVNVDQLNGWILSDPIEKPDFTLTTMTGEPFSFRDETEGYLTLLFFGYTYCPDICPIHMANIAAVKRKLPPEVARQIKVVFVTTDPERDTPERLQEWLGRFDRDFVGLVAPLDEVNAIQHAIGLAGAFREELEDGQYGVAHAAQVLAFTSDNKAHVMYAFGTRQADWAEDLPKLVRGGPPVRDGD